jgi:phosphoribosylanthranilate isomerase
VFVKICGVTTVEDALFAVAMGADAIGMVMAPSRRRVDADTARRIVRELPPGALAIAVVQDERADVLRDLVAHTGITGLQLHGHETAAEATVLRRHVELLLAAFRLDDPRLERIGDYPVDAALIDSSTPGSGTAVDWHRAARLDLPVPLVLAGGLTPDNVAEAIEKVRPWGVDVASGVEAEPGRKDPAKVRHFVARATAALAEFPPPDRPA